MAQSITTLLFIIASFLCCGQQVRVQIDYVDSITHYHTGLPKEILPINAQRIQPQLDSLRDGLQRLGHIDLFYKTLVRLNDTTFLQPVVLGRQYRWLQLRPDMSSRELFEVTLSRKRDYHLPFQQLDSLTTYINQSLANQGYAFNTVQLGAIEKDGSDTLRAVLKIKKNRQRRIDRIVIKGYRQFPKRTLNKVLRRNKVLNDANLERVDRALEQLPFVEVVRPSQLLYKQDSTLLYLYLKKKSINAAEGLLGFNNSRNGTLELNGFLDVSLNNNLNRAERFALLYRNENEDQTKFNVNIELPYIWNSPFGITGQLDIVRRDSTYQNTVYEVGAFYKPSWRSTLGLTYINRESAQLDGAPGGLDGYNSKGVVLNASYIQSDPTDWLMPEVYRLQVSLAREDRNIGMERVGRTIARATAAGLWRLDDNNALYGRFEGAYIVGSAGIAFNELFQFGGGGSIRGFNQNSIDSSEFYLLSTEYRYRIGGGLYVYSILDGAVYRDFTTNKTANLYSYGVGTGILTRAGILGISVANGVFPEANSDLSSLIAHINLRFLF